MSGQANCLRFDRDETRGGYVLTSTRGAEHGALFLAYGEVAHAIQRAQIGYFDGVLHTAQAEDLKFGPIEITPETAEFAAPDYTPVALTA